jgi:hypothetical protein
MLSHVRNSCSTSKGQVRTPTCGALAFSMVSFGWTKHKVIGLRMLYKPLTTPPLSVIRKRGILLLFNYVTLYVVEPTKERNYSFQS